MIFYRKKWILRGIISSAFLPSLLLAADEIPLEKTLQSPLNTESMVSVIGSLFLIVILILVAAWLFKRFGQLQSIPHNELKMLASLSTGQRERIVLLQVGGKQLLVGVTQGSIRTLYELENPIQTQKSDSEKSSFVERLAAAMKKEGQNQS
ncbi:MAG: flagellar biosynthetic protein FliO [Gammaproteobacteria bacterium]|nr:flagellar biosynthetic protein FliO [Gammaproteobacteria bacterium]